MLRHFFCLLFALISTLLPLAAQSAMAEDFTIGTIDRKYYASSHDWYVKLTTTDARWTFCYDIKTDKLEPGTTYTLADMIASYCEAYDNVNRVSHKFTAATYCETTAADGTLTISGTATTADGMDITLHYGIVPIPTPTDTIDVNIAAAELLDRTDEGYYVLHGSGDGYDTAVAVRDYNIAGRFGADALYLPLCAVSAVGEKPVDILDGKAVVKHTAKGYAADAYLIGADALCYHVTMNYTLPAPTEEIDILASNLAISERYVDELGQISYSASNDDYSLELWVNTVHPFGHFAEGKIDAEACIITNKTTGAMQNVHYADIEVSESATSYFVNGTLYGRDGRLYRLNLSSERILPTREETIEVLEGGFFDNSANRVIQLYGYNADETRYVSIGLNTDVLDGNYTKKHTYRDYTFVQQTVGDIIFFEPYAAQITVTHDADTVFVEATLECENLVDLSDHPTFKIRMRCVREDITLGLEFDVQGEDFDHDFGPDHWGLGMDGNKPELIYLVAYDEENHTTIALQFCVGEHEGDEVIPAGTYPINASGAAGTVVASEGLDGNRVTGSYAALVDPADGSLELPMWYLTEGTVVLTGRGSTLYVEVDAINSCRRSVKATIGLDPAGIATIVAPHRPQSSAKHLRGSNIIITRAGHHYRLDGTMAQTK